MLTEDPSASVIDKVWIAAIGAAASIAAGLLAYYGGRKRTLAEVGNTDALRRKTEAEIVAAVQKQVAQWLEKFQQAKRQLIRFGDAFANLRRERDDVQHELAELHRCYRRFRTGKMTPTEFSTAAATFLEQETVTAFMTRKVEADIEAEEATSELL